MREPSAAADLATCDTWPVHAPGAIQPFGCLVALDAKRGVVTHWSENVPGAARFSAREPLPLENLFTRSSAQALTALCRDGGDAMAGAMQLTLRTSQKMKAVAHHAGTSAVIVELEAIEHESPRTLNQQQEAVSAFAASLDALADPLAVCEAATRAIRSLTGYDRVMIYRFHEDFHGEVIAEARDEPLESWLGLHYPATDIPAPARAVFAAGKLRMIPDVAYVPVPIVAAADLTPALDLTRSLLRSVSPIHIEYLQNMRVTASLTLSIKQRGKLWGLVACHHYGGAKHAAPSLRNACAIVSDYLSAAIALRAEQQTLDARRSKAGVEHALREQLASASCIPATLCAGGRTILDLMSEECHGAAVLRGSDVQTVGTAPAKQQLLDLTVWLREQAAESLYVTDALGAHFPAAREYAERASGVLALVPPSTAETAVLWFKPETVRTVEWGGNPEKPVDLTGMRLHPRKSFEAWRENVRARSTPWQQWEVELASSFLLTLAREELRARVESESRARSEAERANRTKEDFIAVISHDLRDPLSSLNLSLLLLKKLLSSDSRSAVAPTLGSMERAVVQMKGLVQSLLSLSALEAGALKLSLQNVAIGEVLHDCVDVLRPLAAEKNIELRLTVPEAPVYTRADREQLLQACSNLVGNAVKFTPENGVVEVRLQDTPMEALVEVIDTGPGIAADHLAHVFDRFYRARPANSRGVGLGLAIAKGVIEAHQGTIGVRSEPGKGSTFWFAVPRS